MDVLYFLCQRMMIPIWLKRGPPPLILQGHFRFLFGENPRRFESPEF